MPRTPPSGADAALIQALAERGVHVSVFQLERWRTAGRLQRHPRRGLGRGCGTRAVLLPEAVVQAEMLARATRQGRAPASVATGELVRAVAGGEPAQLRAVIGEHLRRLATGLGAGPTPTAEAAAHSDEEAEALLEAAGRLARDVPGPADAHNMLLDAAAERGLDVAGIARMPQWRRTASLAVVALRLFAAGRDEVGLDEVAEALGEGLGLSAQAADGLQWSVAQEEERTRRRGEDPWKALPPVHDARTLLSAVDASGDEELLRAAEAVMSVAPLQLVAVLGGLMGVHGVEMPLTVRPDGVLRMLRHPVWWQWGQYVTAASSSREDAAARSIAQVLNTPGLTDALPAYLRFLREELGLARLTPRSAATD
ncbi:hypothetical protein [Streptomyces exfoliatus]|uniref:hypothetical protein n=1 Tax=Streptomyces exfoliatus TaxID=1905 RepID=UPI0004CC5757|nr:hypothetical protein [Streptomyces exfoliatus]